MLKHSRMDKRWKIEAFSLLRSRFNGRWKANGREKIKRQKSTPEWRKRNSVASYLSYLYILSCHTVTQRAIQQQMDRQATIFPGMSSMWRKMTTMLFVSGRSNALSEKQVLAVASRHSWAKAAKKNKYQGWQWTKVCVRVYSRWTTTLIATFVLQKFPAALT